jgi:hypothetical protein
MPYKDPTKAKAHRRSYYRSPAGRACMKRYRCSNKGQAAEARHNLQRRRKYALMKAISNEAVAHFPEGYEL